MMKPDPDKNRDLSHNIHNNLFIKTFSDPENVKIFLNLALPNQISSVLDFSEIKIGFTSYISEDIKDYSSDLVVKTRMKSEDHPNIPVDIYILVEHKTEAKPKALVQVLKYLYYEWQKDVDQKKPLRVIVPMIFYHGEGPWKVPHSFAGQFNVKEEIREFLLDYKYVLFDTGDWDFMADSHRGLKNNVFLLTALVLMKGAYNDDMETVKAIFELWHEKGFTDNKEMMIFFLTYVSYIRDISLEQLKKTLEACHLEGGDIMPSLAQRLIEQGREQGREVGEKENAKEVARRMLSDDFPIATIAKYTGLTEQEVKELMN